MSDVTTEERERLLQYLREQLEAAGVRWEDVPDDDEWADLFPA
jgi:hypothetical protein